MLSDAQTLVFLQDLLRPYSDQFLVLGRVLLALFLGAVIGFEREMSDRPAGLRTHMLVAAAGCLLVSLGDPMIDYFAYEGADRDLIRFDPTRLIEALITGVAFLGAGTIIRREGGGVKGLTTAGSILLAAIVGLAVAIGQLVIAIGTALITVMIVHCLRALNRRIGGKAKDGDGDR